MIRWSTPLLLSTLLGSSFVGQAQSVTFHADVAPIIYAHCTECHRVGEIGPMPLTTYDEVFVYGEFIEYVTATDYMPPWTPDDTYSHFVGERVLTDDEKATLSAWVAAGKPEGNPADNPGIPSFPEGSQIGAPDMVMPMAEPYTHGGDMTDQYQVFVLPADPDNDLAIRALEVRPGNRTVSHHAILGLDVTGTAVNLDAQDPEPGYESFGGFGFSAESNFFGAWVPGALTLEYPPGIGRVIPAGADLLLQMHYGPSPIEETDLTEVNVFFAEEPIEREVETGIMGPQHLDQFFFLPANQERTFHGTMDVAADLSLLSVAPHCHLIGVSWEVFATSPNNQDTIPLISIPSWDFNWQGFFTFPTLTKIPAGYTLHGIASYDNTSANPFNPNDPPQNVTFGEGTTDEMFFVFFDYVLYEEGDELIALGPSDDVPCVGDLTGDGVVSVEDMLYLLSDFGCVTDCNADVDLDDAVTIADLLQLLSAFGEPC
ncbi:MAG: hypothetical protein CMC99_03350 [Flavobacteriales bacterium]|nr:hypothetical protein [Flavobacteriales bacterium]